MVSSKTLEKQKTSSKKQSTKIDTSKFKRRVPFEYTTNKDNILRAIEECVQEKDLPGILEVIIIYFEALQMKQEYLAQQQDSKPIVGEIKKINPGATFKYAAPRRPRSK